MLQSALSRHQKPKSVRNKRLLGQMQQPRGKKCVSLTTLWSAAEPWQHDWLWVWSLAGLQPWEQVSLPAWLGPAVLRRAADRAARRYRTSYVSQRRQSASASLYAWPFNDHALHIHRLCLLLLRSIFHQDLIHEMHFSWTLTQLCSVPMSTNRHWFNGIPRLVRTNEVTMLQYTLFPERMTYAVTCSCSKRTLSQSMRVFVCAEEGPVVFIVALVVGLLLLSVLVIGSLMCCIKKRRPAKRYR